MHEIKDPEIFDILLENVQNVVLDIWAEWCGPCGQMAPILERAEKNFIHVAFTKANVDEVPELAKRFNVMSIPTLLFFQKGKIVNKVVGAVPEKKLGDTLFEQYGEIPKDLLAP